jgi:isocitrate/isopropylmalate dehydrogenase
VKRQVRLAYAWSRLLFAWISGSQSAGHFKVLNAAVKSSGSYKVEVTTLPWGTGFWKEKGSYLPADFKSELKNSDAVLFGSVGMPGEFVLPNETCHRNLMVSPCRCTRSHINLRPSAKIARLFAAIRKFSADPLSCNTSSKCMQSERL